MNQDSTTMAPRLRMAWRLLLGLAAIAVLLGVFTLYTRPSFARDLADLLWSCG